MNRKKLIQRYESMLYTLERNLMQEHNPHNQSRYKAEIIVVKSTLKALFEPKPDPKTGLMPCGCEGKPEQFDFHDGVFPYSRISCLECGIEMMRAGDSIEEAHEKVKNDWNRAMGYKGDEK